MIHIRPVTINDAPALVNIYRYYVEQTNITLEYNTPSISDFKQRILSIKEKYPYLVAESDGQIIGYTYAHDYKGRDAYDWSVEVSIYVTRETLAKGVGTALYQVLEHELKRQHVVNASACITAGNARSEKFHEKFGYKQTAVFKHFGFKTNKWLDVLWMTKSLVNQLPKKPAPFIPYRQLLQDTDQSAS